MKHYLYGLVTSGLLVGSACALALVIGPGGDPTTLEAFEVLRPGMTQTRVEHLIGSPYRRVNITKADGSLAQACFHESLPVANENEITGVALEYCRETDENGAAWILQSKVLARNTQAITFVDRLDNAWLRITTLTGFRQVPTEELIYEPAR
jgi:hypothetical protein